jgi:hypothetical protein
LRKDIQSFNSIQELVRGVRVEVRCEQEMARPPWERHGRRFGRLSTAACERTERTRFRRDEEPRLAALEEFDLPHAGHGATFGQTVFHGGDDLIGKRNLRIGRRKS